LIARSETKYDDRGRVYQTVRYGVNPATGTVGQSLADNTWYDASGNVIKQQPAGARLFTKQVYDGLGRKTKTYVGYDLSESSYADAGTVAGDTIIEQTEVTYDAASNVIQNTVKQRYHNATGTGELTGLTVMPGMVKLLEESWIDQLFRSLRVPPNPMVEVTPNNRQTIKDSIDRITLGGDTCISCAISSALTELGQSVGLADRMIVLSDGEPTAGVRDEAGFFPVAKSARDASVGITTIGVGTSYNHKIMGAIALGSGGNHYFIEDPSSLENAFLAEADKLKGTIAVGATATITLAEGVTLERVYDRSFEREVNNAKKLKVQLGNFSVGDTRTVLLELNVPTESAGVVPVAEVHLTYDDRVAGKPGTCDGKLSVAVKDDAAAPAELDAQVATRVARSQTAATLSQVNELIEQGRLEEAEAKIQVQQQALAAAAEKAKQAAPAGKSDKLADDYAGQASTLTNAREGLDPKKGGAKPRAVRKNVEMMNPYML